jgi:starvation-inducible outer membrane lipoprotein
MKSSSYRYIICLGFSLAACSTPPSQFGVHQQSDGTIGVHSPKDAKEDEAQEMALAECKKLGKRTVTIIDSRKTVNDRFPMTYNYLCR